MLEPLDLRFRGLPRAVGAYLVETDDGLALYDCGPATTVGTLKAELRARGVELTDVRHLLLSHIHFDHAGAAGVLVREHPALRVWVSEIGAPHLVDPSRLEASARRLYGSSFDALFGELAPVPQENIERADGDVLGWDAFPSPGHASHHVVYLRDGVLLAGDACGVRIPPAGHVYPVSPPPDIDVEAWFRTIAEIQARDPKQLALIHFGIVTTVPRHLMELGRELDRWAELVRSGLDADAFAAAAAAGPSDADGEVFDAIGPFQQSWQGLRRYWVKRGELEPLPH